MAPPVVAPMAMAMVSPVVALDRRRWADIILHILWCTLQNVTQ